MDVTDVLRDRMQQPEGLQRMLTASLLAHAAFAVVVVVAQGNLLKGRTTEPARVMTISLGAGGEGPVNGGMTAAAARPVQTVVPAEELTKRDAITPPAATKPEMVLPTNKTPVKPSKTTPTPIVKEAPEGARGRTPTRGTQKSAGEALTYTGARGQGFGLSSGGGPGSGSSLDVADFCCPDYIVLMIERIRSTWQHNQGAAGHVFVKFTIQRDGRITDVAVEKPSGLPLLDTAALRAVLTTRTLNPLPSQFPNPTLGVHLDFEYQ
jgi:TonB family protein